MNFSSPFQSIRSSAICLAIAGLVCGTVLAPVPVHAAPPETGQFGVVDLNKILNDSKSRQLAANDLNKTQQTMKNILQRLDQGSARFLTDTEITELSSLYEKDKPTEAEQKRISQLEEKGDQQKRELATLQNTPKPDDGQTARLTALNDIQDKGNGSLRKLVGTLEARLQDMARVADQKALTNVRASVARVAKAKGLSVVFTGDVAIYATVDITDDVLKDINK